MHLNLPRPNQLFLYTVPPLALALVDATTSSSALSNPRWVLRCDTGSPVPNKSRPFWIDANLAHSLGGW